MRRAAVRGGIVAVLLALAAIPAADAQAGTPSAQDRYSLVHGCFGLRSVGTGQYVAKSGHGYTATTASLGGAEPFRMQATDLGKYLLYGASADFLGIDATPVLGGVVSADAASNDADWTVEEDGTAFTLTNAAQSKQLSVDGTGKLAAVAIGSGGDSSRFDFEERTGCATYPEVDVNVSGAPTTGSPFHGEVSGLLEGHMHQMAFEFLGGDAHCGEPWDKFGAPYALKDCPDHEIGNGCAAILENVLYGSPARCHDPVGWPTFAEWPDPKSLTHEQSYYKWLERSWRGGLRVYTNLLVENQKLCEVYPLKHNSCNEMDSVLLQAQDMYKLHDYIDAQSGGPGKGWYRIVKTPYKARRVINQGKLAVIMGMEVSTPFDCGFTHLGGTDAAQCDEAQIDDWLDRLHDLGVRQLEITNKFDNALTGVAGDNGTLGVLINGANFLQTGTFWDLEPCVDPDNHDHSPTDAGLPLVHNDDLIIGNGLDALVPAIPNYDDGPLCNQRGLSDLGEYALDGIMDRHMIFDPDHMSVIGRDEAMTQVEEAGYGGLISSHSWSTPNTLPRIYRMGGVITPYAGGSEGFYHEWTHLDALRGEFGRQYFGVGSGADMNGFGSQGLPRGAAAPNPVTYPFQSWNGEQTIDKQVSGQRTFDINTDGVAHYGLFPDWLRDVRNVAGADEPQLTEDMGRGAEAYLQMWERADGIAPVGCGGWGKQDFTRNGLGDRVRLNARPKPTLKRAGQPEDRHQTWTWCANPQDDSRKVKAVYDGRGNVAVILSTLPQHSIGGAGTGDKASALPRDASGLGHGLLVAEAGNGRKHMWVVRGGKIAATGISRPGPAASAAALGGYVDLADLPG